MSTQREQIDSLRALLNDVRTQRDQALRELREMKEAQENTLRRSLSDSQSERDWLRSVVAEVLGRVSSLDPVEYDQYGNRRVGR